MKRSNFLKSLVGIVAGATILPKVVLGNEKVTDNVSSKTETIETSCTDLFQRPISEFGEDPNFGVTSNGGWGEGDLQAELLEMDRKFHLSSLRKENLCR